MKKTLFILFILLSFLSGCASILNESYVIKEVKEIDLFDGIDASEAAAIAKDRMLETGFYKDWDVNQPMVSSYNEREWTVWFRARNPLAKRYDENVRSYDDYVHTLPYMIVVDKKSGEITFFGVQE